MGNFVFTSSEDACPCFFRPHGFPTLVQFQLEGAWPRKLALLPITASCRCGVACRLYTYHSCNDRLIFTSIPQGSMYFRPEWYIIGCYLMEVCTVNSSKRLMNGRTGSHEIHVLFTSGMPVKLFINNKEVRTDVLV